MSKHRSVFGAIAVAALLVLSTGHAALSNSSGGTTSSTAAGALAATAGCGKAPTLTSGTHTIQSGGQTRSYILRIPDNYDNNHPYRLIFGFHWRRHRQRRRLGRDQRLPLVLLRACGQLSNNSTIFVAPQGIGNGWANSGGQDVTFVDDMIRQIEAGLCVDTTQLLRHGLQLRRRDELRARVRPGDGLPRGRGLLRRAAQRVQRRHPARSRTSGLHGIRDNVLNISQGRSLRDTFVRNNGCTAQNPPEPAPGSLTHIITTYSGCRAGYPVVWAAFDGGHTPGPVDGT